jgi:hypothetical protein
MIYPKECKSGYNRDTCALVLITAPFTTAKLWKQPRCPTADEWIKKMYIYIVEFHSAVRNNDMWFEGEWMQLEDIVLSEVSQAQKDKGRVFSLIRGRQMQKINTYTEPSMILHKLRCRTCL